MSEKEIKDFGDLGHAFSNDLEEKRKHIKNNLEEKGRNFKNDLKNFYDLAPKIPGLAAAMIKRGLQNQVDRINEEFQDIDSQKLYNQMELGINAAAKKIENKEWESENQSRSEAVTSKVTNAKNHALDKKAKKAERGIKVTSFIGKGLVLFGQKGLAEKMQNKALAKGQKRINKDSRLGKIMETVAETGFTIADGARFVKDAAVTGAYYVEDAVLDGVDFVKESAVQFKNNVKEGLNSVEQKTIENREALDQQYGNKQAEFEDWQTKHSDRSKIVTGAVRNISQNTLSINNFRETRKIKRTSLLAKGVALFGAKGLAKSIAEKGFNNEKNRVNRDSKVTKMAEKGFHATDITKETIKSGIETGARLTREGKEAVKTGALKFGKATYKGAATAVAIASIPLEPAVAGAVWLSGKAMDGLAVAGDKVLDGVEFVQDNVTKARDKISENKTRASRGIKSMFRNFATSIAEKLSGSIDKDNEKLKQFEEQGKTEVTKQVEDNDLEIV